MATAETKPSGTYEAGCHCGFISLSVTLSPPLPEYEVTHCNCSIYPKYEQVTWHHGSDARVGRYQFNTKTRDHMFCPKCGISIGIDFWNRDSKVYGISLRQFNGIDLDSVKYDKFDGAHVLEPAIDLSGQQVEAETGEEIAPSV
ncbi:hypothetical protein G7Z17_g8376 [Cylindrodendrum hubeiense]|uniref:CENP-V/GFA domain-containing protein n=1 Tax=Cylindrodendrum hubeiense TaxID=595255 RepID=A0A9P5H759_9HYPO|nr:hypothetical protein G7Z17_g8376 [Cylindrodendrum hubeiense]